MSKTFVSIWLHSHVRADFDFTTNIQILSVGQDALFQTFDCEETQRGQINELEQEMSSISVHPINKSVFVIGGKNEKVQSYDNIELTNPQLIQNFTGSIHRAIFSQDGKYLGIGNIIYQYPKASQESTLNLFSYDLLENIKCRPSHDGMTLNVCFDPLGRFVLSLGTDGQGLLYQLSEIPKLIRKYKISKDASPEGDQKLQGEWQPQGKFIALPGKNHLQIVKTEQDPEDIVDCHKVSHLNDISLVKWVSGGGLITIGLDNIVKLWHFKDYNNIVLVWQSTPFENSIQQVRHNLDLTKLYVLDKEGKLHWTDLDGEKLLFQEKTTVSMKEEQFKDIYSNRDNAIQDLLNKKLKAKSGYIEEEEEIIPPSKEDLLLGKTRNIQQQGQEKKKVNSNKAQSSECDAIIDMKPQNTLISTKTESFRGAHERKFLLANFIGTIKSSIYVQDDQTFKTIEIDFFDKISNPGIKLDNEKNFELSALNYRGFVLASKGPNNRESDENGYLKDEDAGEEQPSYIYFQAFNKILETNKFLIDLPEQEGAEVVAIGNDWFAVATDVGTIRIFSFSGIQLFTFQLMRPIVTLIAYEQLLVAAYLDSVPMYGNQMMKARVYDIEQNRMIREFEICLTLYSELLWLGFSEEGMIVSQDSKQFVWAYIYDQDRWLQVNVGFSKDQKFWLYAVQDYRLIGFILDKDDTFPDAAASPLPDFIDFKLSTISHIKGANVNSQALALKEMIYAHEYFRFKTFSYLNESRLRKNDPLNKYSSSIWDEQAFKQQEKDIAKLKITIFREILAEDENEKLLEYFKVQFNTQQIMNIAISLLEKKTTNGKLLEALKQLQQEKLRRITQTQQSTIQIIDDSLPSQVPPKPVTYGLKQHINTLNTFKPQPNLQQDLMNIEKAERLLENGKVNIENSLSVLQIEQQSNKQNEEQSKEIQNKPNPFATRHESMNHQSIFEKIEQSEINKMKRKVISNYDKLYYQLINPASQISFGQSNLMGKRK